MKETVRIGPILAEIYCEDQEPGKCEITMSRENSSIILRVDGPDYEIRLAILLLLALSALSS